MMDLATETIMEPQWALTQVGMFMWGALHREKLLILTL